jgi:phosphoglycerol transferase
MGSAYLGLAGVLSLLALAAVAAAGYLRRPRGFAPAPFLAVAFVLAVSVVGGLNSVLGTLGFVWFRATNRYSIWILVLVLLWAVLAISRSALASRRKLSVAAAAVAVVVVVTDEVPPRTSADAIREVAARVASDAAFVRSLEAALLPGAMLFQLPVVDFPEGPRVNRATDYEHLRPYLHSRQLRFSYGSDKGRASDAWQHRAAALEPEALAEALERIGFAGLLVNRKGYEDGARELQERLAASGRLEAWNSPDGDFLFVRLRPSAPTLSPDVAVPAAPPAGDAAS